MPPIFLSVEQTNELLLALFGAGVSIFFVALLEYGDQKARLEDRLLVQAERVVSLYEGLEECLIETSSLDSERTFDLFVKFFEEESKGRVRILPVDHSARDRLIQHIEQCGADHCSKYADDPNSNFNRYVERQKHRVDAAAKSYMSDKIPSYEKDLEETIEALDYLLGDGPKKQLYSTRSSNKSENPKKKSTISQKASATPWEKKKKSNEYFTA